MIEFNKHANVIYNDAGEKNVAAVVLYGVEYSDSEPKVFWDEECTDQIKPHELFDLAIKGLILVARDSDGNVVYERPVGFKLMAGSGICTVTTNNLEYYSDSPEEAE